MSTPLVPPINFGCVEEGLYRSGHPTELNFPFLERLKLKTVVDLAPDEPDARFQDFLSDVGVTYRHLEIFEPSPWRPNWEDMAHQALQIILDVRNYPVLIMCNLGRHRTGTVIGCLRKLQRWNIVSVFEEYRRFAADKSRVQNEQFIELFDTDLVHIPEQAPAWL